MTDLCDLGIAEVGRLLRTGELSPVEYSRALMARIEERDPEIHAFVQFTPEIALQDARRAESEILRGGYRGPLHGIPYGLKDLIDYEGVATTAQSRILRDNVASADAAVVKKLRAAGAVFMGKLTTHEFAIGGPSFDLPWPPARNPWNLDCFTGGSSSGSAAALAAGMLPFALGTDTGGSVRHPASHCGVVGMKPTRGLVSRAGVFLLSYSLDCVGPMTRGIEDNALVLDAIAGYDAADPDSRAAPAPARPGDRGQGIQGVRVGLIRHFHASDLVAHDEVAGAIEAAADCLARLGAQVEEVRTLPLQEFSTCNRLILLSEAYAIHRAWLTERPQDYGALARKRLTAGAEHSAADYVLAQRRARELTASFQALLEGLDVVLTACSMDPPCRLDDAAAIEHTYLRQARAPFNVTGHPAISMPAGCTSGGLPIGVQLVARPFDEAILYRVARHYQAATGWSSRRAPWPLASTASR